MPRTPPRRTQQLLEQLVLELLDEFEEERREVMLDDIATQLADLFEKGLLLHAKALEDSG